LIRRLSHRDIFALDASAQNKNRKIYARLGAWASSIPGL
jgi:hypothetical protein